MVILARLDGESLGAAVASNGFVFAVDRHGYEGFDSVVTGSKAIELAICSVVDLFTIGIVDTVNRAFVGGAIVSGVLDGEFVAIASDMVDGQ